MTTTTTRQLHPALESSMYGAIATDADPVSSAEVLSNPALWQHLEYQNPAADGQTLLKVWKHDDSRPSGYATALYIVE